MAVVKKEEVVESWSILIGGGQGRPEEIFTNTDNFIAQTKAPNVKNERKKLAPGLFRGLFGAKRDFLVVTETSNPRLKPYQMLIGSRDYGNNLDVSWYLTYRLTFWERVLSLLLMIPALNLVLLPFAMLKGATRLAKEGKAGMDLDLFDEQDLRAYVTNAHHCLVEAVEKMMVDLRQDPSKIDRKSRGFLGIS